MFYSANATFRVYTDPEMVQTQRDLDPGLYLVECIYGQVPAPLLSLSLSKVI